MNPNSLKNMDPDLDSMIVDQQMFYYQKNFLVTKQWEVTCVDIIAAFYEKGEGKKIV